MAIQFTRKEKEKFVLISPQGQEMWVEITEGRCRIRFEDLPGWIILREEVYLREKGDLQRFQPKAIRPAISAPVDSPLKETVFQGSVTRL